MAIKLPHCSPRCLCRECGQVFSTVGNSDRHRRNRQCQPPEAVGLVQVAGAWKGAPVPDPEGLARRYGQAEARE